MKYLCILLIFLSFSLSSKEKKSIYVYKILTKNTKDPNFETKFRSKLTEVLLKEYSAYNLMDDDSIQGLKAKLEKSKLFGCNEEACMREISRTLNADEVITGSIEEKNGKFTYSFKNSARVKKGEENLSIKSLADGEFYFNQWEYFTREIVRKLMNPLYTMNYKDAPPYENLDEFTISTVKDLKEIKLPDVKGETLDIVKRLKEVTIADADRDFKEKNYARSLDGLRDARDTINRFSPEEKSKAGSMSLDVQNRIYAVGDAMFSEKILELESYYTENYPLTLKSIRKSKGLDGWVKLSIEYDRTLEPTERNPITEKKIAGRIVELAEKKYRFRMQEEEASGDEKFAKGKYDSAISYYEDAMEVVRNSQGFLGEKEKGTLEKKLVEAKAKKWNPEMEEVYDRAEKKLERLWKEGEYEEYSIQLKEAGETLLSIQNKGSSRVDLVANIDAKIKDYPERLKREEKILAEKISLYTDAAKSDSSYDKKIEREKEKEVYRRKEAQVATFPETFTTKTGIKFFKILKKDGKPVYVSERIRPEKIDSWYFARDYAEKLNKEDNCPDCYRLPYFEEIVNLKVEPGESRRDYDYSDYNREEYEGLWLKSWSPAWAGMTIGNIAYGIYTFDFIHDVVFHPITWQSYVYPISPDSVYASRGGSWVNSARWLRSALRSFNGNSVDRNNNKGFRLVRPLR